VGHSSFVIETNNKSILTDPYDESVGYPLYEQSVDIVTISHDHYDHNAVGHLRGTFTAVKDTGETLLDGIKFTGFASWHDDNQGKDRGSNVIFKIEAENIKLVHLGDLGVVLTSEQIKAIGTVDILLIPVGGFYTIDAEQAWTVVEQLNPRIVIPMHYKTPATEFPIAPVEKFLARADTVTKKPELDITNERLPSRREIIVLAEIA
jgi:L-ascorbate metabolism protein UlaG (beta-lactamase superfamily)